MLIRHTLLYLPAQVVAPLVQFLSIIVWAHQLAPDEIGVATLIISLQELFYATFFLWWVHYALRYIAAFQQGAERRRFLGAEGLAILVSTVLQCAVVIPVLLIEFPERMTAGPLVIAMLFMVSRSLINYMAERARSEAHIALYTIMQIGGPLFGVLIGLGLIRVGLPGAQGILAGFAIAQIASLLVAAPMTDVGRRRPAVDRAILSRALSFGIPAMMGAVLAAFATTAPRFVVEHVDGLAAVGMFAVGYGLGLRASSFAVMLVTAGAYPLVVRKMEREGLEAAYAQLQRNITLVALVVIPVAFGLLAVNAAVVDLLVPEAYRTVTALVLPLSTVGGLLRALRSHTTDQVFLLRSRTGFNTLISIIDLVLAVGLSYAGLMLYGIPGAAAGPLAASAGTYLASLLLARWVLDFKIQLGSLAGIVAAGAIMAAIVFVMPAGYGYVGLGVRVAAGAVLYAAGIVALLPLGRQAVLALASRLAAAYQRRQAAVRTR